LLKGVDLQQYSRDIDAQIRETEEDAVFDYTKEADRLAVLQSSIKEFDEVLEGMQSLLSGFQNHLGTISTDMKVLQEQSLNMNNKLRNRKEAREKVYNYIEGISLPPEFIRALCERELNESYSELLMTLVKKKQHTAQYPGARASIEAGPALRDLTQQVLEFSDSA
jgi:predicted  nucleic acid-binding Zn-ribbon protein